ncbi:hypothetical protein HDF16_002826 [Granulicella aggregans]|uniref:Uncharacterized protein n=1 Tax=Granulicella aggregans TaxID=474949 RepID=A0A7W7ZDW2_9BACT|nr:hypothetical protein [Granulicella aggregans]
MNGLIGLCPQWRSLAEVVLRSLSFQETGRSQPVDATLAWSLLAGVSKSNVAKSRTSAPQKDHDVSLVSYTPPLKK